MSGSAPWLRFVLFTLAGVAVVYFLSQFFLLDETMVRIFLPPPEVH